MSYTYSNEIKYSDSPNLDAFGRLRTSGVTSLLEYKHIYGKLPLVISEQTAGSGTATFQSANAQVVMGVTTTSDLVIRQSKSRGIYQPGKGQLFEASFGNFQLEANVIKRVGYYNSTTVSPYNSTFDGFFLESNGVTNTISFQVWKDGTSILSSPLSSWLTEDYDPTLLDWSLTQLMMVDFQWLGVGRLRFGMIIDGTTKVFVTNSGTNNLSTTYMKAPNQPVRYEIRSSGGSGTLNMICSQVSMEGSLNNLQKTIALDNFTARTLATANVKYPLIGYRLNSGYGGANISLADIQTLNATNAGKGDYIVTVEFNPNISGTATFTNIANTPIDYAIGTGGITAGTGGYRMSAFLGSGASTQVDAFEFKDNIIRPGVNVNGTADEIWICVTPTASNQDFRSSINISYYD